DRCSLRCTYVIELRDTWCSTLSLHDALPIFASELLAVKDSLEMGLDAAADATDRTDALIEGTAMTLKLLGQVFEKFGIVEVNPQDRKSTRLNSSHVKISYAVFCLKKKKKYM